MSTIDVIQDNRTCGHRQDELVVAIPHRRIVQDCLSTEFQLTSHVIKINRVLDLAVLKIDNLVEQTSSLWNAVEAAQPPDTGGSARYPQPSADNSYPLDAVLWLVRGYFAGQFGKWTPTLAKNYEMRTVTGLPHIDGLVGQAAAFPAEADPAKLEWAPAYLGRGVKVGIIDTALFQCDPLRDHYNGEPLTLLPNPDGEFLHWAGHGLFCAGLILRQAGGVTLYSGPALEPDTATTTSWSLAEWMLDARNAGVNLLNVSAGCTTWDGQAPLVLERAIDVLWPDMVIVAAAGNHGDIKVDPKTVNPLETITSVSAVWPAASSRVISVGSTDSASGGKPSLASFNPKVPWQTFVAPGVDVPSTYLQGKVKIDDPAKRSNNLDPAVDFYGAAIWSGSSFATATVTGAIAARMTGGVSAHEAVAGLLADAERGIDGIWTYEATQSRSDS